MNAAQTIQNLINGNISDAKKGAKRFSHSALIVAGRDDLGLEPAANVATADYLKGRCTWEQYCDRVKPAIKEEGTQARGLAGSMHEKIIHSPMKKKIKHVSTPWKLDGLTITGQPYEWPGQRAGQIRKAPATIVARVSAVPGSYKEYPEEIAQEHARLLVAAPELLALLEWFTRSACMNVGGISTYAISDEKMTEARALVASLTDPDTFLARQRAKEEKVTVYAKGDDVIAFMAGDTKRQPGHEYSGRIVSIRRETDGRALYGVKDQEDNVWEHYAGELRKA